MGDLNQDGNSDAVLVLQENNPAKRQRNDNFGSTVLNLNPRRLVVLFQAGTGYQQVQHIDGFLPSEHDTETPCLEDPLAEGGIEIKRGILNIDMHYWLSCGSWEVNHKTFRFRHQHNRFRLIGLDSWSFRRNSGERAERSINYLTGKEKHTTGLNEFATSKPVVTWKTLMGKQDFYLDAMKDFWLSYHDED
ncbi:hypothetical protein [Chitinivorax sp. B]|uniref:hypothetical protein n=1 Tax=Chitinivorax sp. B TaxID=2502235 RepID=UPI00201816E1|nr:hypothetical protein [Chitinivorax sp. B]